ncbi:hypothetical protein Pint_17794 [Pistacia integerrima]|uniref:Uncharacterized protein n=1 Tax=Pistacia integerrima TaxID=434235 RepID=A0ACC0YZX3_9ROSI|nr:hypothetical protein Pint_17794 [Pistacia integerrima]
MNKIGPLHGLTHWGCHKPFLFYNIPRKKIEPFGESPCINFSLGKGDI